MPTRHSTNELFRRVASLPRTVLLCSPEVPCPIVGVGGDLADEEKGEGVTPPPPVPRHCLPSNKTVDGPWRGTLHPRLRGDSRGACRGPSRVPATRPRGRRKPGAKVPLRVGDRCRRGRHSPRMVLLRTSEVSFDDRLGGDPPVGWKSLASVPTTDTTRARPAIQRQPSSTICWRASRQAGMLAPSSCLRGITIASDHVGEILRQLQARRREGHGRPHPRPLGRRVR